MIQIINNRLNKGILKFKNINIFWIKIKDNIKINKKKICKRQNKWRNIIKII